MKTTIVILILLWALFVFGFGIRLLFTYEYKGIIKYKVTERVHSKYSSEIEPVFVVVFPEHDTIQEYYPSWNDYIELKEGDEYIVREHYFVFHDSGHPVFFIILGLCAIIVILLIL
jgi:hypothetical protein